MSTSFAQESAHYSFLGTSSPAKQASPGEPGLARTPPTKEYPPARLESIRSEIESMTQSNQVEILRMLHSAKSVHLNENKNGVYVNMSQIEPAVLDRICDHVKYIRTQENDLAEHESQKEQIQSEYFS